ncbi:MAG TPA: ABC transporter ATP-binding protein [Microbacterium sp.]|nr:ABC transporter ATP-binding protein [Microbacterium sp.]
MSAQPAAQGVAASPDVAAPALTLDGVSVAFRGVKALSDISFQVPAGGLSAVIGPNGAGKTTLFNCVSGIYRHEGEILLSGQPLRALRADQRARAGIARTFQTPTLLDQASVYENVMLGALTWSKSALLATAWATGRSRREESAARDSAVETLEAVGLTPASMRRTVGELAHADRRRVEIARALVARPRLLMLDEPAAGLSAAESDELISMVLEHGERTGMTALLVEHDVSLVMRVARFVAVLDAGRLLAFGSAAEVRRNPEVIAAYIGAEEAPSQEEGVA